MPKPIQDNESLAGIKILYEDNHLLSVVKPIGLSCQGGEKIQNNLLDMLKEAIKIRDKKPGAVYLALVHRLDQPVGGCLLLAKTSKAASRLSEQIRLREFAKRYLAVTTAIPPSKQGRLEDLLLKNRKENQTYVLRQSNRLAKYAKEASLDYICLDKDSRTQRALLEVSLETGRSHQIRVQLADAGWPLWGDYRYNPAWSGAIPGDSVALWASYLSFTHPVTKEKIELSSGPEAVEPWLSFAEYL